MKKQKVANVGRTVEKREHLHTVGRNVNWAGTLKNSMEFPQKIKTRTSIWSSNFTLGICLKKMKTLIQKDVCTPIFTEMLFTWVRSWKPWVCPTMGEWRKMRYRDTDMYVHRYIYLLLFEKKWMAFEYVMLSEICQVDKKNCIISLIWEFLKKL